MPSHAVKKGAESAQGSEEVGDTRCALRGLIHKGEGGFACEQGGAWGNKPGAGCSKGNEMSSRFSMVEEQKQGKMKRGG